MENFRFAASTEILFGKGQIKQLGDVISRYGKRVLVTYGGGSIKRNGVYEAVMAQLQGCTVFEMDGIEPNPRLESVERGVALCRKENIDVVLAVGGGSVIDCSKVIAAGVYYQGSMWDLVLNGRLMDKALPLVTVLTMAATGSEMNRNAVISNMKTHEKVGTGSDATLPRVSILDPEYTFTVPAYQSAAGVADIMSHVLEGYFSPVSDGFIQDKMAEGVLKTCIEYGPQVIAQPTNYAARANIMWASSLALNGLCGAGKAASWTAHPIEHQLSAFYDITHGVGLAILTPRWMRFALNATTLDKFVAYAVNVWGLPVQTDRYALANQGIDATEAFFCRLGIPMTLKAVGITSREHYEVMATQAVNAGNLSKAYVPLTKEDVIAIFKDCE